MYKQFLNKYVWGYLSKNILRVGCIVKKLLGTNCLEKALVLNFLYDRKNNSLVPTYLEILSALFLLHFSLKDK